MESDPTQGDAAGPDGAQQACFEAGIKFGSLYHQFAGTPVSPDSAPAIERAIEESITNQPHCERVDVDIDTGALAAAIDDGAASYTELTGRFMDVRLVIECEGREVVAEMTLEDGYPRMSIASVRSIDR